MKYINFVVQAKHPRGSEYSKFYTQYKTNYSKIKVLRYNVYNNKRVAVGTT